MNEDYSRYLKQTVITENNKKYIIIKYISSGGNGAIFECINEKGKVYVLKLLYNLNEVKIENFQKEIKLHKKINSELIVKCIDCGEHRLAKQKKARPFYIMKKYDNTLEDLINKNMISPLKAFKYSIQLCKAVKVLHEQIEPIIHRDLKPENILYDNDKDCILICDLGLAHLSTNKKTINEGFVGNLDYHAPEQKIRGKGKIGTYTDIYSLGLIMNVLFTKEIAQGEDYKKIWQVSPYFSFVDSIIERMIRHDYRSRENNINSVLSELEQRDSDYENEEYFLKNKYREKKLAKKGINDLIELYGLLDFSLHNEIDWDSINLNYFCDYHFSCSKILINSVLLNCYYNKVKGKFEYEGNVYYQNKVPYTPIDLSIKDNKDLYDLFTKKIDTIKVFDEMNFKKNRIKKYFISLCDYHANEVIKELEEIEKDVKYYCLDAPILYISFYLKKHLTDLSDLDYDMSSCVILDKFEESTVSNKMEFYKNKSI